MVFLFSVLMTVGCVTNNGFRKSTTCRHAGISGCVNTDKTLNKVYEQKASKSLSLAQIAKIRDKEETDAIMKSFDLWCPMQYKEPFDDAIDTVGLNIHISNLPQSPDVNFSRRLKYICWARATHVLGARPYYEPLKVFQNSDGRNMVIYWVNDEFRIEAVPINE